MFILETLQHILSLSWGILLVIYFYISIKQPTIYKIFTVYIFMVVCLRINQNISWSIVEKIWLSYILIIIQDIVLSIFYLKLLKEREYRRIAFIVLFIFLIVMFSAMFLQSSAFILYSMIIGVSATFVLLITLSMMLYYRQLQQECKTFFYFNIGLIFYMVGISIITWVYLFIVSLWGESEAKELIYRTLLTIMDFMYIYFVVIDLVKSKLLSKNN